MVTSRSQWKFHLGTLQMLIPREQIWNVDPPKSRGDLSGGFHPPNQQLDPTTDSSNGEQFQIRSFILLTFGRHDAVCSVKIHLDT
jgi:hypothetical protein